MPSLWVHGPLAQPRRIGPRSKYCDMNQMHMLGRGARLFRTLRDPKTPTWIKFLPILALVYWVSPVDIIPDPLLIVGWLDDLVVVVGLISQTVKALDRRSMKALPPVTP